MRTYEIKGMSCDHCVRSVGQAAGLVQGLNKPSIDLEKKTLSFEEDKTFNVRQLEMELKQAGYELGQEISM